MAANFWASSHSKQLLDREELSIISKQDQEHGLTTEDVKLVKIHMSQYIKDLAQQAKVRQRVVATAIYYFRRTYVRRSFSDFDPRLVAPSCLYLASKAEESTVQAKLLVFYIKKLRAAPEYRYEIKDILEMEMKLLEALDYHLVVYHPYRPLVKFLKDAGLNDMIQPAWALVNDIYLTDLSLMYAPYIIALACMYMTSVLRERERDVRPWFEELKIEMTPIRIIIMEMFDYYENYSIIDTARMQASFAKLPERTNAAR